jgi:hypothetical protein
MTANMLVACVLDFDFLLHVSHFNYVTFVACMNCVVTCDNALWKVNYDVYPQYFIHHTDCLVEVVVCFLEAEICYLEVRPHNFCLEDWSSVFLQNFGNYYTTAEPKRENLKFYLRLLFQIEFCWYSTSACVVGCLGL